MPMLKIKKPPELIWIVAAWFLAGLLFALISATAIVESRAADPGRDDALTAREICEGSCNREHTICLDSSGAHLENFGESRQYVGSEAACDKDLRECLHKCGVVSPVKDEKREPEPTSPG